MLAPFGICRQALVSALRFVRQVFRHFERVVGTELKHFDSFVRHFVAHFMPVDPSKHAAYAVWNALEQRLGAPWQSCSCRAFLTHSRVAGLNGWGWSVVEVVEVVVDVVVVVACGASPASAPCQEEHDARQQSEGDGLRWSKHGRSPSPVDALVGRPRVS